MNTKTITNRALSVIDQYLHFKVGSAVCAIPYFNNKTVRARAALRVQGGKGSPQDIFDEIDMLIIKNHLSADALTAESLKKIIVDDNIGIDCSGFAYYVLNAESLERGKGTLDKHISFVKCTGMLGKFRAKFRPVENCDVGTLADDANSRAIEVGGAQPGDIITMQGGPDESDRDHVLVIHQIEYQNFIPLKMHYSHAVAYPEDGVYGSGVKQGTIEIPRPDASILEQRWTENGLEGALNRIFSRAQKSTTELRRLND